MAHGSRRNIRIFISSTFSDFILEREALHERVFPQLESFCRARGASFQPVDLRWGVNETAMRRNDTLRICLEEIARSRRVSPKPNFVALIGDRYGWCPLPTVIPVPIWDLLRASVSKLRWRVVARSYLRQPERNLNPPAMILRRSRSVKLNEQHAEVREVFRDAAQALPESQRLPLIASATHQEIHAGLLAPSDAGDHVHVYFRRIQGLAMDSRGRAFVDWDELRGCPCAHSRSQLAGLQKELLNRFPDRVHEVSAHWRATGLARTHLDHFCEMFLHHQQALIERELCVGEPRARSIARVHAHQAFAASRASGFRGRQGELESIMRYLRGRERGGALVITGKGGSGKSALLAAAAKRLCAESETRVFARFVGASDWDVDSRAFSEALRQDIATAFGQASARLPDVSFAATLRACAKRRRVVIFVDAADQLEEGQEWDSIGWIPETLPGNVRMVISARDGEVANRLMQRSNRRPIRLGAYPIRDAGVLLREWVAGDGRREDPWGLCVRRLHRQQVAGVLRAFRANGRPLWLRLAAEEARHWESGLSCPALPDSIESMFARYRTKVLKKAGHHGSRFVDRSLAFLASCRAGISESEIGRALATDREVRLEFRATERTTPRWRSKGELPPVLWSRLRSDLEPFLMQQEVDGALVLRFFHSEIADCVRRRVLRTEKQRRRIHCHLARVFVQLAPSGDALIRACNVTLAQDIHALRRIMEEPWHRERSGRSSAQIALLSDPVFCVAKYAANRSEDHMEFIRRLPTHKNRWLDQLDRWSSITSLGDRDWPAHRILVQLALEAELGSMGEASRLQRLVSDGVIEPPPLLRAAPPRYSSHFHRRYRVPVGANVKYWIISDRYLEVRDERSRGLCIDIQTGVAWKLQHGQLKRGRREKLVVESLGAGGPSHGTVGVSAGKSVGSNSLSGCAPAALVLGSGKVVALGKVKNCELFESSGFVYVVNLDAIAAGTTEVFTGEVCDSYKVDGYAGQPIYSRFAANFIESDREFLSLGWSGSDGNRESFLIEVFEIEEDRVTARALVQPLMMVDMPIKAVARLRDGTIIVQSDCFRTLVAAPPMKGEVEALPYQLRMKYGMAGQYGIGWGDWENLLEPWPWRMDTKVPLDRSEVRWIADGFFGSGRDTVIEAPASEVRWLFEEDSVEGVTRPWLELRSSSGELQRWVSDVPIEVALELGQVGNRFLLLKQSGPVVVRRV